MITQEINRTYGVRGAGFGALPTDAQLSTVYGYLPYGSGWLNHGPNPNGSKMIPYLNGATLGADPTVGDVIAELKEQNRRQLILSSISVTAVVIGTLVGIWKLTR